jgi:hypothetical protein
MGAFITPENSSYRRTRRNRARRAASPADRSDLASDSGTTPILVGPRPPPFRTISRAPASGSPSVYLLLQNRTYLGEIVHKRESHPGEHAAIIDQPLWDAVRCQLVGNTAERKSGTRTRQPSLLAGILFDRGGNRMTPTHAVKKGTRYRYCVSRPLITKDQTERSAGLRIPAAQIDQLVASRVRQWLLDPGSIYKATRLPNASEQRRLVARTAQIGKSWPVLPGPRQRAFLTALIERIEVGANLVTQRAARYTRWTRLQIVCRSETR